jgi:hypothetical protein
VITERPWRGVLHGVVRPGSLVFAPVTSWCRVCGRSLRPGSPEGDDARCDAHAGRNPCAIEGCRRSTSAPEDGTLSLDQCICGTHWRLLVPIGSARRRAYHAHFRRAKRHGWTPRRIEQFNRFWDSLIASARRRSGEGHIDKASIDRLFGWDQPQG